MVGNYFNQVELFFNLIKYLIFESRNTNQMNRIKKVLKSQYRTQKYLADKTGLSAAIISMYCNNLQQPRLDVLEQIARLLDVDIHDLIEPTKQKKN
jgi:putative transcriptional regulator